ncbi:GNAT family N-acetyltransferase [archaeon]|nr:GNAT family N-acetyltransferase [archaeon]MBL7056915.1 GNAT family N-acetyltransferase [Candidatus Woesearchaeota archaeon]
MIIKFSQEYLDALADIDYHSGLPYYDISNPTKADLEEWLSKKIEKGEEEFYLYKEGEEILGAVGWKKYFEGGKNTCEITYLSVKKTDHSRGIGTQLLKYVEGKIRSSGFHTICLTTSQAHNEQAINFYQKHGYANYGVIENHHREGVHSIIMKKKL